MHEFSTCPECRTLRKYVDGKCQTCGYISKGRAAINFLYSTSSKKKSRPRINYSKSSGSISTKPSMANLGYDLILKPDSPKGSNGSSSKGLN
jgi:hypothetical protein